MADYWIKLYHEIIDDPKMATLPDRLWRRVIEIFLLAGRLCPDKSGNLPDTRQLAWLLRISTDELQSDLSQLTATGIIVPIPNGWKIVNFKKRQEAATSTERVKQFRERNRKRQYYDDETETKRNVAQINRLTEAETETETEAEAEESGCYFSDDPQLESIYTRTTSQITIPATGREDCLSAIRAIRTTCKTDNETVVYLQKYFREWKSRHYSLANTAWLTDWAVSGEIPEYKNGKAETLADAFRRA